MDGAELRCKTLLRSVEKHHPAAVSGERTSLGRLPSSRCEPHTGAWVPRDDAEAGVEVAHLHGGRLRVEPDTAAVGHVRGEQWAGSDDAHQSGRSVDHVDRAAVADDECVVVIDGRLGSAALEATGEAKGVNPSPVSWTIEGSDRSLPARAKSTCGPAAYPKGTWPFKPVSARAGSPPPSTAARVVIGRRGRSGSPPGQPGF